MNNSLVNGQAGVRLVLFAVASVAALAASAGFSMQSTGRAVAGAPDSAALPKPATTDASFVIATEATE
jgi:hypothetical protein